MSSATSFGGRLEEVVSVQVVPALPGSIALGLAAALLRDALAGAFQPVLDQQVYVIPLVEDLALHVGVMLPEQANLPVLLRHQLLIQRGDLDEGVVLGQVEVRSEPLIGVSLAIPADVEGLRLVLPLYAVEVEEFGKLPFGVVGELGGLASRKSLALRISSLRDFSPPLQRPCSSLPQLATAGRPLNPPPLSGEPRPSPPAP